MSVPDPLSAAFHHSLFVFFLPRVCLQEESQTIVHLQNMEVTLWELPPPPLLQQSHHPLLSAGHTSKGRRL